MAQTMKDVKAISIPVNGTNYNVKKIEDSNGDIIWGSLTAFPYRKLEYIDIPADSWINLANSISNNSTITTLDINLNVDNETITGSGAANNPFGVINSHSGSYDRYHLAVSAVTANRMAAWYANTSTAIDLTINARHTIVLNSNSKVFVDNVDKGTFDPTTYNAGSLYLGARHAITASSDTAQIYSVKIRVWSIIVKEGNNTSVFTPVQRKSDGAIGLLKDFNNGYARALKASETATACIAGPVVDEYWDLTA